MRSFAISSLVLCCTLTACAGANRDAAPGEAANSSAIVIRNPEISGSVLHALRTRVPSIRITTDAPCPRIRFRGSISMNNQPEPSIYVDNTLMGDTCALTTVSPNEIDRIEVYPSGETPDATIRRNASGVIIIYRRRE